VSPTVIVNAEPNSPQSRERETPAPGATERANPVESWLEKHLDAVALGVVAAGFIWRMVVAGRSYFNPDELLHYLMINQPSAWLAYQASLTNAHPPLIYAFLYLLHFLSRSEWVLRLPSVIAGTALCWALYKWIGTILGKAAGLIGLLVVTFCPAIISLSAEVREYALLLFCMTTAMYFLERAFQEKSVAKTWGFSGFLYLAILSHYSAAFFALAIGIYALARIADDIPPRKVMIAWASGQAGALAIYAFLYVTQISKLKNSIEVWGAGYDESYFRPDRVSLFTFTRIHTSNIFLFLFGQRQISQAMLLFFIAGLAFLFFRDLLSGPQKPGPRRLGILFFLPFLAVWGASIATIYPYVGTRHTVFLAPFAIAAISFFLAAVSGQKLWAGLLMAVLLMGVSNASGKAMETGIPKENQSRALMAATMNYIHQSVPQGDVILADYESSVTLAYYLCGSAGAIPNEAYRGDIGRYECAGYTVLQPPVWKMIPQNLQLVFKRAAQVHGIKPGARVWVFQAGWGETYADALPNGVPATGCGSPKGFGANIAITPFVVGPDLLPVSPLTGC